MGESKGALGGNQGVRIVWVCQEPVRYLWRNCKVLREASHLWAISHGAHLPDLSLPLLTQNTGSFVKTLEDRHRSQGQDHVARIPQPAVRGQRSNKRICHSRHQWLIPVILATQEVKTRKIVVRSQPRQIVRENLS
jgi:hypothetical protein